MQVPKPSTVSVSGGQKRDMILYPRAHQRNSYTVAFWKENKQKKQRIGGGRLLLRWVVGEADTLCDIALESFYTSLEEGLFVIIEVGEWVIDFLYTACLLKLLAGFLPGHCKKLTPSSTGTEKKSQPVSFAMASPPGTPGR